MSNAFGVVDPLITETIAYENESSDRSMFRKSLMPDDLFRRWSPDRLGTSDIIGLRLDDIGERVVHELPRNGRVP